MADNERIYLADGAILINGAGEKIMYHPRHALGLDLFLKDADFRFEIDGKLHDVYYDTDDDSPGKGTLFTRPDYLRKKGRSIESGNYLRHPLVQSVNKTK